MATVTWSCEYDVSTTSNYLMQSSVVVFAVLWSSRRLSILRTTRRHSLKTSSVEKACTERPGCAAHQICNLACTSAVPGEPCSSAAEEYPQALAALRRLRVTRTASGASAKGQSRPEVARPGCSLIGQGGRKTGRLRRRDVRMGSGAGLLGQGSTCRLWPTEKAGLRKRDDTISVLTLRPWQEDAHAERAGVWGPAIDLEYLKGDCFFLATHSLSLHDMHT